MDSKTGKEFFFNKDDEQKTGGFLETRSRVDSEVDENIDKILDKLNFMQAADIIYNFDIHFGSGWIKIGYNDTPFSSSLYTPEEFLNLDPYNNDHSNDLSVGSLSNSEIWVALECMKALRVNNDTRFLVLYRISAVESKITSISSIGTTRIFRDIETLKKFTAEKVKANDSNLKGFYFFGDEEYCKHASCLRKINTYSDEKIDLIVCKSYDLFTSNTVFSMDFHCASGMIKIWYHNNPYNPKVVNVDQYLTLSKDNSWLSRKIEQETVAPSRKITKEQVAEILQVAKKMRFSDQFLYLRYLSVNIPGDKITILYTCGGTYCVNTMKFLGPSFDHF